MVGLDVEPAEYVRLDLFPCIVTGPETTLGPESRVILTDNHLYVIVDAPKGPELALKEPFEGPLEGNLHNGYQIGPYSITKQVSCGCGSRLRGIFPFLGVPYQTS